MPNDDDHRKRAVSCSAWEEALAKRADREDLALSSGSQRGAESLRRCVNAEFDSPAGCGAAAEQPVPGALVGPAWRPRELGQPRRTAGRGSVGSGRAGGSVGAWRHGDGLAGPHGPSPRSVRSLQFSGTVLKWISNWRGAVIPSPHVASRRIYLFVIHLSSCSEGRVPVKTFCGQQ